MVKKTKQELEQEQAQGMTYQWEKDTGNTLDDKQRATLQRMIELNSNTAQQDVRRSDYYNGGSSKYDKSVTDYQVRNDNSGQLNKRQREVFALKPGQQDVSQDSIYHNGQFDNQKLQNAINSIKKPETQIDNVKTTDQRMQEKEPNVFQKTWNSLVDKTNNRPDFLDFIDNTLGRFSKSTVDTFFPRLVDQQHQQLKQDGVYDPIGAASTAPAANGVEKTADIAGTIFGYVAPTGAAYKAVAKPIQLLTKGKELAGATKIAVDALRGASAGTALGLGETARDEIFVPNEKNAQDHLKQIAFDAASFGVGDGVLSGLGRVVNTLQANRALNQLKKAGGPPVQNGPLRANMPDMVPKTESSSSLKSPSSFNVDSNPLYDNLAKQANVEKTPAPVMKLKEQTPTEWMTSSLRRPIESLKSPIPAMPKSLDDMMKETKSRFSAQKEYNQAVDQQYEYLKNSMGKGVDPGNVIRNDMGDVVGRYGRISNNPTWYQDFYKAYGRKPNNTELRQLAADHVRNGYKESGIDIPSWSPTSVKNIDNQIDEISKMMDASPENKDAYTPLLDGLQKERQKNIDSFYAMMEGKGKPLPDGVQGMRVPKVQPEGGSVPEGTKAMTSPPIPLPKPSGATSGKITRQEVLDNIKNNLGVTVRTGRLNAPIDIQGFYKVNPEVIRSRNHGDLQVISHEIGHHLDKQLKLANPQFDQELMHLGVTTSGKNYSPEQIRQEGLAEFVRLHLVDPQAAQQQAPNFSKFFTQKVPSSTQKALAQTSSDIQTWINQGESAQFRGQINVNEKKPSLQRALDAIKGFSKTGEQAYTEGIDRLFPIAKAEKEILGGNLADASQSAYKQARLAAGTPRIAEQKLNELRTILQPLEKSKYSLADVRDYITAVHAQDLEAKGIESGFTHNQIQAVLNKYGNAAELKKIQEGIVKYNNTLLDELVQSSMLSKESVAAMREKHPNYVPFFRHFDEEAKSGLTGKGFVDLTNPIKRMKGSTRDVIDPIESIIKNTFSVAQASQKNKVGIELARLAEKPGAGKWIEQLDGKQSVRNENIVTVFQNGEKVQYQLAPELYRAVKALDKEITNKFVLAMAKPTDWLRAGATLTPEFALRNPIRDQFNATVVSDVGYNPIDMFRGLNEIRKAKTGKGSAVYDDWVKQGGAFGGYLSADRNVLKQNLDSLTQDGTKLQRAIRAVRSPSKWLEGLQKMSEISEEATKVGAYKKGLKKGLSPAESAFQSRDLMDFNRMGNSMQAANRLYAFLNANVQGKDKLIRAFRNNPVRTSSRILGMTIPPTALAYASYEWANEKQKATIDNMPQWEKDTYWAVAVPGTNDVARIPKPFDINGVPNYMEKGIDYFAKGDKYAFENKNDGETIWKDVATALTPTAARPFVENAMNHSFFTDGPIVPKRDEPNSPKEQYGPTTSESSKALANALDKVGLQASPYKVDNLYRSYTAGLGQYPLSGLDKVITALTGNKAPTPVGRSFIESAPGVKAFFTNDLNGGKVMDDYYRIMDQQNQIKADAEKHDQVAPNESELKQFNKVNKDMSKLRASYQDVMSSTDLTPKEKRDEIDRINEKMKALARQGIQIFRADYK